MIVFLDTGIGPESFQFSDKNEAMSPENNYYYFLRPEVVESWFVLYRVTGNKKYREWSWKVSFFKKNFLNILL